MLAEIETVIHDLEALAGTIKESSKLWSGSNPTERLREQFDSYIPDNIMSARQAI